MTSAQKGVIWMGLILIILNAVTNWQQLKSVIFSGSAPSGSSGGSFLPHLPGLPPLFLLSQQQGTQSTPPKNTAKVA